MFTLILRLVLLMQQRFFPFLAVNDPLLDKVGCVVIGDFQMDQRHLMSKVSLKSSAQDHIWSQKEGVSGTKHF